VCCVVVDIIIVVCCVVVDIIIVVCCVVVDIIIVVCCVVAILKMANTSTSQQNKRKRIDEDEDDVLLSVNELAAIKSLITADGLKAAREIMIVNKLSSNGSRLPQLKKSRKVSVPIPSFANGMAILNKVGTVTKTTSKSSEIKLTKEQLHQVLPDFPNIIKKGAYGGCYRTQGNTGQYIFTFCDSIVEEAVVTVTQNKFSIEFKGRFADSGDPDYQYDADEHLRDLSAAEYWRQKEVKPNVIQSWRHSFHSDIVGHIGRYI